jgi:mRNA interferase RelE/StbE
LSRKAEKFYKKLQGEVKAQVRESLLALENEDYLGKRLHGNLEGRCSLKVGKLRIIYTLSNKDKTIYIVAIGPRETIYR